MHISNGTMYVKKAFPLVVSLPSMPQDQAVRKNELALVTKVTGTLIGEYPAKRGL